MGSNPPRQQLLGPETRGQAARRGGQDVFLAPQVLVGASEPEIATWAISRRRASWCRNG